MGTNVEDLDDEYLSSDVRSVPAQHEVGELHYQATQSERETPSKLARYYTEAPPSEETLTNSHVINKHVGIGFLKDRKAPPGGEEGMTEGDYGCGGVDLVHPANNNNKDDSWLSNSSDRRGSQQSLETHSYTRSAEGDQAYPLSSKGGNWPPGTGAVCTPVTQASPPLSQPSSARSGVANWPGLPEAGPGYGTDCDVNKTTQNTCLSPHYHETKPSPLGTLSPHHGTHASPHEIQSPQHGLTRSTPDTSNIVLTPDTPSEDKMDILAGRTGHGSRQVWHHITLLFYST